MIEVPYSKLLKFNITPNQYFIALALYRNDSSMFITLRDLISEENRFKKDIMILYQKSIIIEGYDPESNSLDLTKVKISNLFDENEVEVIDISSLFDEFLQVYPSKTPDGRRRLHSNKDKCRKKYESILRQYHSKYDMNEVRFHNFILQCVQEEENNRLRTGGTAYWKQIETYLNKKGWQDYEEDVKLKSKGQLGIFESSKESEGYGTRKA